MKLRTLLIWCAIFAGVLIILMGGLLSVLWDVSWAGPLQQTPGPRLPDDPDQLTWTTQQHVWYLIHQFSDAFIPVLALAVAGAGGAIWSRRKKP